MSEASINEEPDNLSIDIVDNWSINVIEYLDSSTNDSLQQRAGDVIRKCRSIVKLINKSSILMSYVLILKKQFNTLVNYLVSKILGKIQGTEMLIDLENLGTR